MDNNTAKNKPPKAAKPVKPTTEEQKRKRQLAWICGILAFLNLVALALLILLPYNCKGTDRHHHDDNDSISRNDTIHEEDTTVVDEEKVEEIVRNDDGARGFMEFSIVWNTNGRDIVDLDAHAEEPNGEHIYFRNHCSSNHQPPTRCGGILDIDKQDPPGEAAEHIVWPSAERLDDGDYEFGINNFDNRRFGECVAMLKVGDKRFLYRVGYFENRHPRSETVYPEDIKPIVVVTIKNHQVENIRHIVQPEEE